MIFLNMSVLPPFLPRCQHTHSLDCRLDRLCILEHIICNVNCYLTHPTKGVFIARPHAPTGSTPILNSRDAPRLSEYVRIVNWLWRAGERWMNLPRGAEGKSSDALARCHPTRGQRASRRGGSPRCLSDRVEQTVSALVLGHKRSRAGMWRAPARRGIIVQAEDHDGAGGG